MTFIRSVAALAVLAAIASATLIEAAGPGKRTIPLESRQNTCSTPGWVPACPGLFKCVPPGAICCSDNVSYAMPPDACPDGTQPVATAITPSAPSPQATITTPPAATQTIYREYFFTITWYYYYYYLTYLSIDAATITTSYEVTTYEAFTLSATDDAQATALFHGLSATIAFPTPTQTATGLSGAPGPVSTASLTTIPLSTYVPLPPTSTTKATSAGTSSVLTTPSVVLFTGGAASFRAGSIFQTPGASWAMGGLIVVLGFLMLWL